MSSYVGWNAHAGEFIGIYAVSKTAILQLTKVLALSLEESKIRVNSISPGLIRTKLAGLMLKAEEAALEKMRLDRVGEPEDMANVAAFLCSNESFYMNGENISATRFVTHRL